MLTRRGLIGAGGLALAAAGGAGRRLGGWSLAGLLEPGSRLGRELGFRPDAAGRVIEIRMASDPLGTRVWFDPIGLHLEPGTIVRWVVAANVHTTTAYHPANAGHSLRIPEGAAPWDSGFLVNPADRFEVTLTVEGVYDYFCAPHEAAGMVGRLVVGRPRGPGALPFDYFVGRPGTAGWKPVPPAAQAAFPSVARILAERRVRAA